MKAFVISPDFTIKEKCRKYNIRQAKAPKWFVLLLTAILLTGCTPSLTELEEAGGFIQEQQAKTGKTTTEEEADTEEKQNTAALQGTGSKFDAGSIPEYAGEAFVEINGNKPFFTDEERTTRSFEQYSELDELGRCGVCFANIGQDIMPTEERGEIGQIRPTGWHTVKYKERIDGLYLYNRCHLIGYQLSGENANEQNLITGTRYLNMQGMLPFENEVADYVKETANHVLYRVTPVFEGENLVASGVLIEAESVEDAGAGVTFCVYCYNVQPGITINYADGSSSETDTIQSMGKKETSTELTYVLNTKTNKFHLPSCSSTDTIKTENRQEFTGNREKLIEMGYEPCKRCSP